MLAETIQVQAGQRQRTFNIGWFVLARDVNAASVRYRCFHIARALHDVGMRHSYFTDADKLCAAMKQLDGVVIVKRVDLPVARVVASAHSLGKAVFLDMCDDLLADSYGKNTNGIHSVVFSGVAPLLDGIVTPSAAMAERMKRYCQTLGKADTPVHVIPDIAETEDLYRKTAAFLGSEPAAAAATGADAPSSATAAKPRKTVLWFGSFGAPHSNFGIASLLPAIPALREVHKDIPLELVVVSNDEAIYQALVGNCGVPGRYVAWTANAVGSPGTELEFAL